MSKTRKSIIVVQGTWESVHNPVFNYGEFAIIKSFNSVEFDGIKIQAGLNSFTLTPKQWIEKTGAIGLISKSGHYV